MQTKEERVLSWLIPGIMTATLGLAGWMTVSVNRISENVAVIAFRIEAQAAYVKDLNKRVRELEIFAALKGKPFESLP